jgi:hypothetical protein
VNVVVCLGNLSKHENGQPMFMCKVYGPFADADIAQAAADIQAIEGGCILVRPLVDLADTIRRISAD